MKPIFRSRNRCLPVLMIALSLGGVTLARPLTQVQNPGSRPPYERNLVTTLQQEKIFSLGGVGFAGSPTDGLTALKELVTMEPRERAIALLRPLLLDPSTAPETRLYANAGLLALNAGEPDALNDDHRLARVAQGCIVSSEPVSRYATKPQSRLLLTEGETRTIALRWLTIPSGSFQPGGFPEGERSVPERAVQVLVGLPDRSVAVPLLQNLITYDKPGALWAYLALHLMKAPIPKNLPQSFLDRRMSAPLPSPETADTPQIPVSEILQRIENGVYDSPTPIAPVPVSR